MSNQGMETTTRIIGRATLSLIQGDITKQRTGAIVNAANSSLMGGGGVDGAIHRAGGPAILENCRRIVARQGRLPTGEAVTTTAGNLASDYVIHTVGPVWRGGKRQESSLLTNCYTNSLRLAEQNNVETISFPSISTGVFGYPVEEAAKVALQAVSQYLKMTEHIKEVVFVLFDADTFEAYKAALSAV
jgi:O-acetyl-ADP-ribose deacetylase (regulator of RNase III)